MRMAVSYSRANKFEQCPAMFKALYIDEVKETKGLPLLVGIFLHDLLDRYFKHLIKTKQPSDYTYAKNAFEEAWKSEKREGIPEAMYEEVLDVWDKTMHGVILKNIEQVVGSEMSLAFDKNQKKVNWFSKEAFLRMKIDRLDIDPDWNARVWDYKTGHKIDDTEGSPQLKLYGLGVKVVFPQIQEVTVELYYPQMDITKKQVLTEADLEEGRRWILGISNSIEKARETGKFDPTPGGGCATCPIFEGCPARDMVKNDLPPDTIADAEKLLGRLLLVEQERKGLQERLKLWVGTQGPVIVNGKMCDLVPTHKKYFPGVKVAEVLSKMVGINSLEYLKGDGDKLKKLAKKDIPLQEALEEIVIDKPFSQFKIKNARS